MSIKTIYNALTDAGLTPEGACGLMGNMMAESAMRSNNVEDRSGIDDDRYVQMVDAGHYDFSTDYGKHYGFGLCQWTLASRKENLLNTARKRGCSVADEAMQVDFAVWELQHDFPNLWGYLCSTHDTFQAAQRVCLEFERPAVNNVGTRYAYAQEFFDEFANGQPAPAPAPAPEPVAKEDWKVKLIQFVMQEDGYWPGKIDGLKTPAFLQAFSKYAADVAAC